MSTRIRIVAVLLATVSILVSAGAAAAGWLFLRGEPAWYAHAGKGPAGGAEQVEAELIHLYNHMAMMHAWHLRQGAVQPWSVSGSKPLPPADRGSADPPFEVKFTDAELNAFFDKWADTAGRREAMSAYLEDPRIQVRPGEMILAARVKRFHTVISLQLLPSLDQKGRLAMNLHRVYGGILPLPEMLWAGERDQLVQGLNEKYDQLRPAVQIRPDGTANGAASAAAINRLLVATLQHVSADPVLFLPYDLARLGQTVPTKVQSLRLEDGVVTLTVCEIDPAERESLLATLRGPTPAP